MVAVEDSANAGSEKPKAPTAAVKYRSCSSSPSASHSSTPPSFSMQFGRAARAVTVAGSGQEYLDKFGVGAEITKVLTQILRERPVDPVATMAELLLKASVESKGELAAP